MQALLEAVAKGEEVAPAPAPAFHDRAGHVRIPDKWSHLLKNVLQVRGGTGRALRKLWAVWMCVGLDV